MSDHNDDTPAAAPTLAELNRHLFAAILPETHALAEQADDEPKKTARGSRSVVQRNDD